MIHVLAYSANKGTHIKKRRQDARLEGKGSSRGAWFFMFLSCRSNESTATIERSSNLSTNLVERNDPWIRCIFGPPAKGPANMFQNRIWKPHLGSNEGTCWKRFHYCCSWIQEREVQPKSASIRGAWLKGCLAFPFSCFSSCID